MSMNLSKMSKLVLMFVILLLINLIGFNCEERYLTPEEIQEQEEQEVALPPNPYVVKKQPGELDDEFDKPDMLSTEDESANPTTNQESDRKKPKAKGLNMNEFKPQSRFDMSIYEIMMAVLVVVYILNCLSGKSTNDRYASKWVNQSLPFLESNYAHIGTEQEYTSNSNSVLLKESYNYFKCYASGRVNVRYATIGIDLKKRQDLVSMLSSVFVSSEKDRLTFDIALDNPNELQTIFCICKKKDVKTMNKNYGDLKIITKQCSVDFFPTNLTLLAEDKELFTQIFEFKENANTMLNLLSSIESHIDLIYLTDRRTFNSEKFSIFFSFDLTSQCFGNNSKLVDMIKFVHLFIDNLSLIRQSPTKKAEAEKNRTEYERNREMTEKETEQLNKKREDKAREQELKKQNLSREQLLKLEEKEQKKNMKKKMQKSVKILKK